MNLVELDDYGKNLIKSQVFTRKRASDVTKSTNSNRGDSKLGQNILANEQTLLNI